MELSVVGSEAFTSLSPNEGSEKTSNIQSENGKVGAVFVASNLRDANGDNLLMRAVRTGDIKTIIACLQGRSEEDQLKDLSERDRDGNTVLMIAVQTNNVEVITALQRGLSSKARLKTLEERNLCGTRALMLAVITAAFTKNTEVIFALLRGLSPDDHLKALEELLPTVCRNHSPKIIEALLTGLSQDRHLKALSQVDRNGDTAVVTINGREKVRALFKGLSQDNHLKALAISLDKEGRTALLSTALQGDAVTFIALLEGLSLDKQQLAVTYKGQGRFCNFTPLDGCLYGTNNEEIMKLLLSLEAPCSIDSPLSEIAMDHLLHIRFGLKYNIDNTNPENVAYQSISDSLHCFMRANHGKKHDFGLRNVEAAFLNTTAYQFLPARTVAERILQGERVVIPTGWPGHSTAVVLTKELIVRCNRGARKEQSGMTVFEPSAPLTLDALTRAIVILRRQANPNDFYQNLDNILGLKQVPLNAFEVSFVHRKGQKDNNCIFASAKTALAALLFIEFRNSPESLAHAVTFYKKFTAFDRYKALNENPEWAALHPEAVQKTRRAVIKSRLQ